MQLSFLLLKKNIIKKIFRPIIIILLGISSYGNVFAQCNMNPSPDISLCHGDATSLITFTGPNAGTTYSWTNNTPMIGLAASGNGDISPFFVLNGGPGALIAQIVVTPLSGTGAVCVNDTFLITVNPIPNLASIPDAIFCSGIQADIIFSSTSPGTTFDWTNDNILIGLSANGVGNISFIPTNNGTTPIIAQISPGAINTGCENRNNNDFTITVNPSPVVNSIPDQVICDNVVTNPVNFTNQLSGTTYTWTNDMPSVGLAANGNGNIGSFTAVNTTANPVVALITVTPVATNGCIGSDSTFTITVNPVPLTNSIADQVLCASTATTGIMYTSVTPGTTFSWVNDTPSIGLVVGGNGDIPSFTGLNATSNTVVATIIVTPTANGCVGPDSTFTLTINPIPLVNSIADQVLCANTATAGIAYISATPGTTFSWVNDTPSIGLVTNGNGNIPSFTGLNTTSNPVVATITVTPTANGCIGADSTLTITVNPIPLANSIVDQVLCANTATTVITYVSTTPGTTFSWINDTPSIGLLAGGNGDIASFTVLNATLNPVVATITVTPSANGCVGPDSTFTITVNPVAITNSVADQVLCANTATAGITYSSTTPGTTFSWVNDTPSIGLLAGGNGNIPSFTGLNTTSNPVVATITVTPLANGCVGPDSTFTMTINPIPITNLIADQVLCANTATAGVTYSSTTPGTTFSWVNDTPSIGLLAAGNGNIPSFTGLNATSNPVVATITVTPSTNGCVGPDSTFTLTINPVPLVNSIADQVLCANTATTAITYTSTTPGATFSWVNDTPSIGLLAGGNGNIPSFTGLNTTSNPVVATITVTPLANGCVGPDSTFTLTINPVPLVNSIANQVLCANTATAGITYSSTTPGTTFSWVNDTPSIGLLAGGNGNIPSFTGLNTTPNPVIASITVTPTANGCIGPDSTFTITINPVPLVNSTADQVLCANSTTAGITYSSATSGTTFSWLNDTPSIGLLAAGNGNIPSFTGLNTTSNPIVATITVTPLANGCTGPDSTFTITVNPTPLVNSITDQVLCVNTATTTITYVSTTAGTIFTWVNTEPSIGLLAGGNGNIPSFTGLNTTSNPIVALITVTPTGPNGCAGPDSTFTITINPIPLTNSITDQVLCANTATAGITYSSTTPGATFSWINDTPSIGLLAAGNGNISSFTGLNATPNPIVATITVTPLANGCVGPDSTFTLTVNPIPLVNSIADQVLCANTATAGITYSSTTPGTTFSWINDTPSICLLAAGNGNIPSFTGLNTTSNPVVATITVTPLANGCVGSDSTFTLTINPIPITNLITDQVLCANTATAGVTYSSTTPGTTFSWVNDTPSIGLLAAGNGNILSFTGLNTTPNPVVATITVTPTANGCVGPDSAFTLTINPIPLVNSIADQVLCANTATAGITYVSTTLGVTFSWVNDTPSIGLLAGGNGNIPSFTGLNTTSNPVVATITVTPLANGCVGSDSTFTLTINPTPLTNLIADQVLCANTATAGITYISATPGTTFSWVNDTPSIGLLAAGNGNIPSFTGLNTTPNPVVATIIVTSLANGCVGPDSTFTITINPIPLVNSITDQVLCANTTTAGITYSSTTTGTTFSWLNDTPSIGLLATGNGNIPSFTGLNTTSNPVVATITVTPLANGCVGPDSTFTLTINPTPLVNSIANQVLCANTATAGITYVSTTLGTTFSWVNDTPSIGLLVGGNGNIPSFTGLNTTSNPIVALITVTPTGPNGCAGPDSTFTITINPIPLTNSITDQVLCANTATAGITYSSTTPGVTFSWINDTPSIGLLAAGNGNIPSFTGLNATPNPIVATITVTPLANGCVGPDSTFTLTVNPTPLVNSIADQVLCANTATAGITYSSTTPGTTFSWINDTPSIGLLAAGNGNIPSFTGLNTTSNPVVATITVTPLANGCVGSDSTFTLTINPTPITNLIADQVLCANTATAGITYISATPGTTFSWVNDTPSIGLLAGGNGNIPSFIGLNTTPNPVVATITVTPLANGCVGPDSTFTLTINPIPLVNSIADQVLCANTATTGITYVSTTPGAIFSWVNDTPSIGLLAGGNGNIPSFTGLNTTSNPVVATITVTPLANGCVGSDSTFTLTINPTPLTNLIADQVLCANTATAGITYISATPGTTFSWVNDTPSIGLLAGGNGNIPSFIGLNTTPNSVIATITVTPLANGCVGPDSTFTFTINPTPLTNSITDQVLCANTATTGITYNSTTPGTTFSWVNDTPSIGLLAAGNGNIPSFTGLNATSNPVVATVTVTPLANGCVGPDSIFTITVNPIPLVNSITDQVLCNNTATAAIPFTSTMLGTTFSWINDTPSIGLLAGGNGNIPSFTGLNTTSNPIVALITVTPTGLNGCAGPDSTFTLTINPTPLTNLIVDQVLCANTATAGITYSSTTPGATFSWINDTPSIGLLAAGNGNIPSFTGLNATPNPIVATITVTPLANGCVGPDSTFTLTVNPTPLVNSITDQVLCANTATAGITYSSTTPGTTFSWINDTPSIGLLAAGNGNIPSFTGLNTTPNPVVATITVTPLANGCVGSDSTFTLIINPTPLANSVADQVLCTNTVTAAVIYSSATVGTTFSWVNDTPSIGLLAAGNGNIPSFTGLNTTPNPVVATITVTPLANGCVGPDSTFTITVSPTPLVNSITDQVLCANTATAGIIYSSTTPGATFSWVNDTPSIGLLAAGNGNIPSFTGLNTTSNPVVATITVTPSANGCIGSDSTFTLTINPVPLVNSIADQVLCANTATTIITYTSTTIGTTFSWVNDTPSIGLLAGGNGNIPSFIGLNTTPNPVIATITVTPLANGCVGPDSTLTITINPTPLANSITDQVLCANTATTAITYVSATPGTTFSWVNDTPSIGLLAGGNGNILTFTGLNTTSNPVVATIIVTPTANGCVGPDSTFTITINPVPLVNSITDQVLCANTATTTITYSSGTLGTTFSWVNDTPSIGLLAGGNGNIPSFTGLNITPNPVVAIITVTPIGTNGCAGPDSTFTLTINPMPLANSIPDQALCTNAATTIITYSSATVGTTYSWINDTPSIGLLAGGNGDIPSFMGLNTTSNPVIATITVTPTANGCVGPDSTFTITVNPTPLVNSIIDQVLCANTATAGITYSSTTPGATFSWVNDTPSIGLLVAGNGNIPSFTGLNTTSNPVVATITVIPSANGCAGPDSTFTLTINPMPLANSIADQVLCTNTVTAAVIYSSATVGTTFSWINDTPSIGLLAGGNGNIPSFTGLNVTSNPVIATITVTPLANGCVGPDSTFTMTVNPTPLTNSITDQVLCANTATVVVAYSSVTAGTTYSWVNDTPSIGLLAGGIGNIPSFTGLNTTSNPVIATITVTPSANGCAGPDSTFTMTINPTPLANSIADQVLCTNTVSAAVTIASATLGTTFTWTNDTPSIGLVAGGNGNIPSFTGLNTTANPVVATFIVTPMANGCVGPDSTFTITVNPTPIVSSTADQVLCGNIATTAVTYTSTTPGTTFSWTNDIPSIGLLAAGNGDIPSFTGLNMTCNLVTATITVTPIANGCVGSDSTFTITIDPIPLTDFIADTVLCANTTVNAITYSSCTPGTTFSWTNDMPSIGLLAAGIGNIGSFTGLNTTPNPIVATITVTPITVNCQGPDSTFTITINPTPLAISIADQVICNTTATDAINYTSATIGTTFSWVNDTPSVGLLVGGNGNIASFIGVNTTANPIIATITVTPTANGCVGPDSITIITVNPTPLLVNSVSDTIVCANFPVNGITYASATPGTTFPWVNDTPSIGLAANGVGDIVTFTALNITPNPIIATITVTPTANGCAGADSTFTITVNPTPLIDATSIPDLVFCANDMTNLIQYQSATVGTTYDWINNTPSIGLAAVGNGDITPFTVLNATQNPILATITVKPTANGCVGPVSTFTILVNKLPIIYGGDDAIVCAGDSFVLTGSGGVTYDWNNNVTDNVPFIPILAPSGIYTVTGTDINGCENTDNVTIFIEPLPVVSMIVRPYLPCAPASITFINTSTSASGLANCTWDFGDGTTVVSCDSVAHVYEAGTFNLTLTTTSNNGCTNSLTNSTPIVIDPLPIASFTVPSLEITTLDAEVEFENTSTLATTYSWNLGDGSPTTAEVHPVYVYPDVAAPQVLEVVLVAYSPLLCTDTATKLISFTEELIYYVPNAFTPDGTGINDVFKPEIFSGVDIYDFRLLIFNRWGELVFESYDPEGAWDGNYAGGPAPDGVYVWKLDFGSINSDERTQAIGHVTLLR